MLIGGEAGSGKSRLVGEFAQEARDGALVLYGASDAVVHTPYGPFVEALEHLTRVIDPVAMSAALGSTGGELARLLPDLADRVGELAVPATADPDTERHRLHTAVTNLLDQIGRQRPILLVIDDAQWADTPTLLLLRHLIRTATRSILLLATFRDADERCPKRSHRRWRIYAAPTMSSGCALWDSPVTTWSSSSSAPAPGPWTPI